MSQKKSTAIAGALILAVTVSLSACASSPGPGPTPAEKSAQSSGEKLDSHYTFYQELPDGDKVLCVWAKYGNGGGLSCDWVGLHKDDEPTPSPTS